MVRVMGKDDGQDHGQVDGSQAGAGSVIVVPKDFVCARCGYPSGASGSVICPECGHAATAGEVAAREKRREVVRRWEAGLGFRSHQLWVGAALVSVVGVGVVSESIWVSLGAAFLLCVVLPPSVWFGSLELSSRDEERHAFASCIWQQQVWILHLPWLVWPALVVVALCVGLIEKWGGGDGGVVYTEVVRLALWPWALGCVMAFGVWWKERLRALAAGGYWRLRLDDAWAFGAGLVVVLVASFLGFLGGVAVALGVAEWLGLHEFLWF